MNDYDENTLNHVTEIKLFEKMMDYAIIFRNIEGIKIENLILSKRTHKETCDLIRSVDVL